MSAYPSSVYAPRTKDNLPGYPYTPTNKYIGYAEDFSYLENEVLAIITDLVGSGYASGLKGASSTFAARFTGEHNTDGSQKLDTDGTLTANSDTIIPSQKAIKTYSDKRIVGPTSCTDNSIPRNDGTTGTLQQNSGVIIDDSNNISGNSIKASGAEQLKFWTYTHILTAEEAAQGEYTFTTSAVTLNKIRAVLSCTRSGGGTSSVIGATGRTSGASTGHYARVDSPTACKILWESQAANDIVNVTIIEAI